MKMNTVSLNKTSWVERHDINDAPTLEHDRIKNANGVDNVVKKEMG